MNIKFFSDKGLVRSSNQDAFMTGNFDDGSIWAVVCDGMGGANGGNVASRLAVDYFSASLKSGYRNGMSENSIRNLLDSAVSAANVRVFDKSRESSDLSGMGTTIVACLIINKTAYFIHAGDSRAYILSNGNLNQITRDHSIVQNMIESGKLSVDEARFHPRKNVITRALGVDENISADYTAVDLITDDKVLMCTDGLTNYVDINDIVLTLSNSDNNQAEELVQLANNNGGGDNITAVVIDNI
jgi:protein phosphatase